MQNHHSRAVNHPEKSNLFKLLPKHKTLRKSSLGHKDSEGVPKFLKGRSLLIKNDPTLTEKLIAEVR